MGLSDPFELGGAHKLPQFTITFYHVVCIRILYDRDPMSKRSIIVDMVPVRREVVSPKAFLRLTRESPHLIARSRFVAPTIGRSNFGSFEVSYTTPVLKRGAIAP